MGVGMRQREITVGPERRITDTGNIAYAAGRVQVAQEAEPCWSRMESVSIWFKA